MIFNSFDYYLLFLFPAALIFKLASIKWRPWVLSISAALFYLYFSLNGFGGIAGAICLSIFLWECFVSRWYQQRAAICLFGVAQSILFLVVFKYWNYLTGLIWWASLRNPWHWPGAFLPLGISFFTFEFIHYAVDRYRGKAAAGSAAEYLAFIMFFPTMVAGRSSATRISCPSCASPKRARSISKSGSRASSSDWSRSSPWPT